MAQITTKELSGITDHLSDEMNLVAKFKNYAQNTQDAALVSRYEQAAQQHQKHFEELYSHLK